MIYIFDYLLDDTNNGHVDYHNMALIIATIMVLFQLGHYGQHRYGYISANNRANVGLFFKNINNSQANIVSKTQLSIKSYRQQVHVLLDAYFDHKNKRGSFSFFRDRTDLEIIFPNLLVF